MLPLEEKRIVIKLPKITLRSLLTVRFFLVIMLLLTSASFGYWYKNIRPYMAVSNAYINAYSTLISSDKLGQIVEIGPGEGETVKKGDLLFSFDREGLLSKKMQIKNSFNLISQQIDFENDRMAKAMDRYLAAENNLELGIGGIEEVEKQLRIMEEAQNGAEERQSKLASIKMDLDSVEQELKMGAFFAPFDGVVLKRYKNEGAFVSIGDPVYSLCDPDRLWVEAEIPEKKIHNIEIGMPAKIRISAFPKKKFMGKVSYIGLATVAKSDHLPIKSQDGFLAIKISIKDKDISLKPGLSAKVDLKVR